MLTDGTSLACHPQCTPKPPPHPHSDAAQLPIDKADRCHRLWRASPTIVRGNIGLPGAYRQQRRVQVGEAVYLDFARVVGRPNN